jgi:ABC-type multidrug transport system ATPase subunit
LQESIDVGADSSRWPIYLVTHVPTRGNRTDIGALKIVHESKDRAYKLPKGEYRILPRGYVSLGQGYVYYESFVEIDGWLTALRNLRDLPVSDYRRRRLQQDLELVDALSIDGRAIRALEDAPRFLATTRRLAGSESPRRVSQVSRRWGVTVRTEGGVSQLDLDFTPIYPGIPHRVIGMIGPNGTGKSALLAGLGAMLTDSPSSYRSLVVQKVTARDRRRVDISRLIMISYGAFDQSPLPEPHLLDAGIGSSNYTRYFYRGLRRHDARSSQGNSLRSLSEIREELTATLRDLQDPDRRLLLMRCLDQLSETSRLSGELSDIVEPTRANRILNQLSSGQLMSLNILVGLIAYLEPGSLVLIDEPEVHLHPPLVSALIRSVFECLEHFDSLAVIATHSSVVIQELPSRNVRILHRGVGSLFATRPEIETYGETVGVIENIAFGMNRVDPDYSTVLERVGRDRDLRGIESKLGKLSLQATALALAAEDNAAT